MSIGRATLRATFESALAERYLQPGGAWRVPSLDALLSPVVVDGAAITDGTRALTSHDVEHAVGACASALQGLGVTRGDAVAWQLPNCWEAVVLCRACWRIGALAAPLHHLVGTRDIARMLDVLAPAVALARAGTSLGEVVEAHGHRDGAAVGRAVALDRWLFAGAERVEPGAVTVDGGDLAVVLFTSGSSGVPKAVLHTHRSLACKTQASLQVHDLGRGDAALLPSPIAHISGMLNAVLVPGAAGMRLVLMDKWDAARGLELIERHAITFMIGPPTLYTGVMDQPDFAPERVASMRVISTGAMGVRPAFVERAAEAFGAHVKRAYGSTEAPTVTTTAHDEPTERGVHTDGRAHGDTEVIVVDPATGEAVAAGETGEVWTRGPELFAGYADPAQTAEAVVDGWFRTGDLGVLDVDGWLRIVGRIKDLIIRGGENIAASEVEQVLEAHPSIRQAVAVGYPDERLGERVAAFVALAGPESFDVEACRAWFAAQGVAKFKTPERVVVLADLPVLGVGKPDRAALREQAAALAGSEV